MPCALIQLISEQTMQNLLPVLRLAPDRLVHLATPRTAVRSRLVAEGARQAGLDPELETVTLTPMPGIPECFGAVAAAIQRAGEMGLTPVVNFTGGTKLMSIGAYAAARVHKTTSLYVDTQDNAFVDGHTGTALATLLDNDASFTPLARRLTVNAVAVAQGVERVTGGSDWRPLLGLARHLLEQEDEERATHEALYGKDGFLPMGRAPRDPGGWLALLDQPFGLPGRTGELAAGLGLVRAAPGDGCFLLPDSTRGELEAIDHALASGMYVGNYNARRTAASEPMQRALGLLTGGWWEVVVADAMDRSGFFRDLRWSVMVGERQGPELEEDILALAGVQMVYVSCKRSSKGERLQPHLEELSARARTVGGAFTRKYLAVRYPAMGAEWRKLEAKAAQLAIRLVTPENLDAPETFAPPQTGR